MRLKPGEMETDGKTWLRFSASDGYIYVEEMQLEGKKRIVIADFLEGLRRKAPRLKAIMPKSHMIVYNMHI